MDEPVSWSYELLRENILSIYSAITSNAASWIRPKDKELLPKYEGKTQSASVELISNLCTWIHQKDAHKAIILLIIEAKRASMLMMPVGFALALEGFATLFEKWFPAKTAPIKNKNKAKRLRSDLLDRLEIHKNDADFDMKILQAKINDINKSTNRERLKMPFYLLKIPLSQSDELALDYRNALLHGNVILEPMDKKNFEMEETELAMRLLTLTNAIVLKLMKYNGWIVNHVKTQELGIGKAINEEYYRSLGSFEVINNEIFETACSFDQQ